MSDQPETMLEYHFRKLAEKVILSAMLIAVAVFASTAAITSQTDPVLGVMFASFAVWVTFIIYASVTDGRIRRFVNLLPGDDLTDLERPNAADNSEVLADD